MFAKTKLKLKKTINYLACFALFSISTISQNTTFASTNSPELTFKKLSIEHGLSQSYVFNITQDIDGFIWFATEDGLERYDGKQFNHYRHNIADHHSIADNFIRKIYIDKDNTLWVGTNNGLSRYNKQQDNFDNFYHQDNNTNSLADNEIWDIYEGLPHSQNKGSILWVTTQKGLHQFNRADNSIKRVRIRGFEKQLQEIKTIFQDHNRKYWLGTFEHGIYLANESFSNLISLQHSNGLTEAIEANALYDMKAIDDDLWLATDNGLYILDRNYQIKQHLTTSASPGKLLSNNIRAIASSPHDQVWLGTKGGLNIINLMDGSIASYSKNSKASSLAENWLMDIFQDKAGNMWLATFGKGLNIFSPISTKFFHELAEQSIELTAFAQTTDGTIWFASPQLGLSYLVNQTTVSSNASEQYQQLPLAPNNINYLFANEKNELWLITTDNQLYHLAADRKTLTKHSQWQNSQYKHASPLVYQNNTFWYIDIHGLLSAYQLANGQVSKYRTAELGAFTSLGYQANSHNAQATLWLTNASGQLVSFDIYSENFTQLNLTTTHHFPINETKQIYSSNNWLWLTTHSAGVALINKKTKALTIFNENNTLLNNYIASLLIDDNEVAWLATNKGISVIMPDSQQVKNFSQDYQLTTNEFTEHVSLKTTNNIFYFGGINGYHRFAPEKILEISQEIPTPVLTDLFIANQKISVANKHSQKDNNFYLTKQLNQLEQLNLSHAQSPFSIAFISPNAKLQQQIKYRYRLKGLDKHWIEANTRVDQATYTNLSAGDYLFEVEAYDLHRPHIAQRNSLSITIAPPLWLSPAAILFYLFLGLLVIAYIFQQLHNKRLYHQQIQQSEERLKLSLWGSGDEMWDWNINTGNIYRSNTWGLPDFPQDGRRNTDSTQTNIHPHDISRLQTALDQHFADKSEHFEATYRVKNKDNHWHWVLDRGKVVERNEQGQPIRMTGTLKDISQIKKAGERLKLFAKCIENISDAVIIYDRQFTIVDVNKAFTRITLHSKTEMLGASLQFSQYPESVTLGVKKHLLTQGTWHGELEEVRGNDEIYLIDLNIDIIRDENNEISHFVGVFSDITQRKKSEAELRKLANTDTLTNLPNRAYFQANQLTLVNNKTPHALLIFDLDNFKKVNDSLGHGVGDALLCKVAKRLLDVGRAKDTVYRLGGDEFSIIIEDTNDIHTITSVAKEVVETIAKPLRVRNQEIVLYSSVGIVLYPEDGVSPQELLKNADTAMYHAKDEGGNKYQFFNDSMNKQAVKRLQIENLIRHGLKDDYFSVFFQPKIEIASGKISGMEALVRFKTPSKGVISPGVFIPVSEETGQIIDIGEVVLRKSCFATKRWVDAGLFAGRIAVNLSAVQFTQPNLVGMISQILTDSGLDAKYLELEITEGTIMDSPQKAIDTMLQIRAMGIHLSLDDFGTGYSSLAYLKKFPLNTLKIDKAFVDDIESSQQGRNMVATIVTIAHNLNLAVVAEGVETNQQLSFLSGLKCEQLQGYLYSKPLPEADFEKYLISHQVVQDNTFTKN